MNLPQQQGPPENEKKNPIQSILAGGLVGAIELQITYPFEFIKNKMQLYPKLANNGLIWNIKNTYQTCGFFGFYKGMTCLLIFTIPNMAIRFSAFEYLRNHVFIENTKTNNFISGMCAGAIEASIVGTIQETVKVKLIHDRLRPNPMFKGTIHGIQQIVKTDGIKGIYKGMVPTILRQSTSWAIRFALYDEFKYHIHNKAPFLPEIAQKILAGGAAGFISVCCNAPIDMVKSRIQGLEGHLYTGMIDCAKKVYKEQGFLGFYSGVKSRMFGVILDVSICLAMYDYVSYLLQNLWPDTKEYDYIQNEILKQEKITKNQQKFKNENLVQNISELQQQQQQQQIQIVEFNHIEKQLS